jgi:hypothetical protein
MQKEVLKAVLDNKGNLHTMIHGNVIEMISAWLAISEAVARALEERPMLKGADQRQAMLGILAQSFEDKNFIKRADDDDCDGCDDCEHCDSQDECKLYNKAIEQGLSKDEAMLLTLLGKIIGGKK